MAKIQGAVIVNEERCKGCNLCVVACPASVLKLTERAVNHKGYPYAQTVLDEACTGCSSCAIVCPDGCITVYRKKQQDV